MVPTVNVAEARGVDVRVDLGRADVGMSEELLDGANIRSVRQHVRSEAMPEDVRRDAIRGDSDCGGPGTDDLEDALSRKRPAEPRQEDVPFGKIAF